MDSRFPTHYLMDRRVLRATPPAFRQFVFGTAWAVTNGTDGRIAHDDLPLVTFSSPDYAAELVKLGLWTESADGYRITDFQKHQTSAAQMEAATENRRERDRARKQKDRSHDRGDHSLCTPGKCSAAPSSGGTSADSPRTIEGKSKSKSKRKEREDLASDLEEVDLEKGEINSTPISPAPGPSELFGDPPAESKPEGFAAAGDIFAEMRRAYAERGTA